MTTCKCAKLCAAFLTGAERHFTVLLFIRTINHKVGLLYTVHVFFGAEIYINSHRDGHSGLNTS
jgi:hypothetical protein